MKGKELFMKKNWEYIIIFILPWLLVLVHSIVRESWFSGGGSLLSGNAGEVYYEMYAELWNKVHEGSSLLFSWNAGIGNEFLLQIFNYLFSPFTILILFLPKAWLADGVQVVMILKWSLAGLVSLYFFEHTKLNMIKVRKKLICILFTMAFCFGNAVIYSLSNISWLDVMILFPLLLLLEEQMTEGKGYKRFWLLLTLSLLCNFRMTISVMLFLLVWYVILLCEKEAGKLRAFVKYVGYNMLSLLSGMAVILPALVAASDGQQIYADGGIKEFCRTSLMSFSDFIQRFFVCDTRLVQLQNEPVLYCSVVLTVLVLLYAFIPVSVRKKILIICLAVSLAVGMMHGSLNLVWHGYFGINEETGSFAFLFVFVLLVMALQVMTYLESLKWWHIAVGMIAAGGCMAYAFFSIYSFLNFYVYLGTFLLAVFTFVLLFFFCKKSIRYANLIVVFAILGIGELAVNAFYQFSEHNMYTMQEMYHHGGADVLSNKIELKNGERVAYTGTAANYGMTHGLDSASGQLVYTNRNIQKLYENLGLSSTEENYIFFGGSPLLNWMFNIRYGLGAGDVAFSDAEKIGENSGYGLYQMQTKGSLGYMTDSQILEWKLQEDSPFQNQNTFVQKAVGGNDFFEIINPEVDIVSVMLNTLGEEHEHSEEEHEHSEEEHEQSKDVRENVVEGAERYTYENGWYRYSCFKTYTEDYIKFSFESDGVTDYYVYLKSDHTMSSSVSIGEEVVYGGVDSTKCRTYHIGVVPKGETILITSNPDTDSYEQFVPIEVAYQIAAFDEKAYKESASLLGTSQYQIQKMTETSVSGEVEAAKDGVMMTSIPAFEGFDVYVDGKAVEYHVIGDALIGVPLEKGKHKVEFCYHVPYLKEGVALTLAGLVIFTIVFILGRKKNQKESKE